MKLGRKIFFDKANGAIILDTGEWNNAVSEKTAEEEVATYPILQERNRDTFDVIELPFGWYEQDIRQSSGYQINTDKLKTLPAERKHEAIEFIFQTSKPEPAQTPLSEQVKQLRRDNGDIAMQLADTERRNAQLQSDLANLTMNLATKGVI